MYEGCWRCSVECKEYEVYTDYNYNSCCETLEMSRKTYNCKRRPSTSCNKVTEFKEREGYVFVSNLWCDIPEKGGQCSV